MVTTVHAYTNDQHIHDAKHKKAGEERVPQQKILSPPLQVLPKPVAQKLFPNSPEN